MDMLKLINVARYIQRMRAIRQWAVDYEDPIMYSMADEEVQWWKKIYRRLNET